MPTDTHDQKTTKKHADAIATHNRNWLKLDYEMINTALDIEVNPEMSPLRIRKTVETRLAQMSKIDRSVIPLIIWTYLDALDVTGLGQFDQYNPTAPPLGGENRAGWFSISIQPPNTAYLVPRKCNPVKFLQSLRQKERYRLWEKLHKPSIVQGADRIILTAPVLTDLTSDFLRKVFESF